MTSASKSWSYSVIYDPDAVIEFVMAVKSKEERKAIFNAVDKLRELGERLPPPHMKPLQGRRPLGCASCVRDVAAATGALSTGVVARSTWCSPWTAMRTSRHWWPVLTCGSRGTPDSP
jgi:hypothetical protein